MGGSEFDGEAIPFVDPKTQKMSNRRSLSVLLVLATLFSFLLANGYIEVSVHVKPGQTMPEDVEADLVDFSFGRNVQAFMATGRFERLLLDTIFFFFGFWILHYATAFTWKSFLGRQTYYSFSVRDRFFLAQRVPSALHALLVGAYGIKVVFVDWQFEGQVLTYYSPEIQRLIAFSTAYELYDMIIMYTQTGADTLMYYHHICLILSYFLCVSHKRMAFMVCSMLITELTVLPTNLHNYLKMFEWKGNALFEWNQTVRLWSFILIRLTIPPFVFYHVLWLNYDAFMDEVWLCRYATYVLPTLLFVMNIWWTQQLIKLYYINVSHKSAVAADDHKKEEASKKKN